MERQNHQETISQWKQKHSEIEEKYTLCIKKIKKLQQENLEIKEERRVENLLFQK